MGVITKVDESIKYQQLLEAISTVLDINQGYTPGDNKESLSV